MFSKKIKQGETYQIKICTKYKNKSIINPVNFFWKLMKLSSSAESFMIRDKDYSIVSCSPETLIEKKGNKIRNTKNHLQKANEIGGTYSTPPLATIIFVAINIGWTNNNI